MTDKSDLRRICLVGVRGVGKSTLVRRVLPQLPGVDHVLGSAILRQLAGAEFALFDALPPEVKQGYRERAVGWMVDRQATMRKHILCDGHTALLDTSTGKVGNVFTELDCEFFRELILLEAPAEVIRDRRLNDTKPRALDIATIRAEVTGERETSMAIAAEAGMRLHLLPDGDDDDVAAAFAAILAP